MGLSALFNGHYKADPLKCGQYLCLKIDEIFLWKKPTEWESMHGNHNCCNQWSVDTILDSALLVATIKTLDYSQDYLYGPHLQRHQHLWKMTNDQW